MLLIHLTAVLTNECRSIHQSMDHCSQQYSICEKQKHPSAEKSSLKTTVKLLDSYQSDFSVVIIYNYNFVFWALLNAFLKADK